MFYYNSRFVEYNYFLTYLYVKIDINPLKAQEPSGALGIGKIRTSGPYKVNSHFPLHFSHFS